MDNFLAQCLESEDTKNDETRLKALQKICNKEKMKRRYRKISGVLQRLKNGQLNHLDIPIYYQEDNIVGWESITSKQEVNQAIIYRNNKNLNKSNAKHFGYGEAYHLIHYKETLEEKIQAILDGKLSWKQLCEMVNNQFKKLKRYYDEKELEEESENIGATIKPEDFNKLFVTKPESTESSPQKLHVGH